MPQEKTLQIDHSQVISSLTNYASKFNERHSDIIKIRQIDSGAIEPLLKVYDSVYVLFDLMGAASWIDSLMQLLSAYSFYELKQDVNEPSASALCNKNFEIQILIQFLIKAEKQVEAFRHNTKQNA